MKGFQGPIASAQIPHFSEDNMNNLQKIPKKNYAFWMGNYAFWMGKNAVSNFGFFWIFFEKNKIFQKNPTNPKKSKKIQKHPKCGHLFD